MALCAQVDADGVGTFTFEPYHSSGRSIELLDWGITHANGVPTGGTPTWATLTPGTPYIDVVGGQYRYVLPLLLEIDMEEAFPYETAFNYVYNLFYTVGRADCVEEAVTCRTILRQPNSCRGTQAVVDPIPTLGLPNFALISEVGGGAEANVKLYDRYTGALINGSLANIPSAGNQGVGGLACDPTTGRIYYTRFSQLNNSQLWSVELDGTGHTARGDVTFAQGQRVAWIHFDPTVRESEPFWIFVHKVDMLIKVNHTTHGITKILQDSQIAADHFCINKADEMIYYSIFADTSNNVNIKSCNYLGGGAANLIPTANFTLGGVANAQILGMDYDPILLRLLCVNSSGELFSVNMDPLSPTYKAVTLLKAGGAWNFGAVNASRFFGLRYDYAEHIIYVAIGKVSATKYILRVLEDNAYADEVCLNLGNTGNVLGFDFAPAIGA